MFFWSYLKNENKFWPVKLGIFKKRIYISRKNVKKQFCRFENQPFFTPLSFDRFHLWRSFIGPLVYAYFLFFVSPIFSHASWIKREKKTRGNKKKNKKQSVGSVVNSEVLQRPLTVFLLSLVPKGSLYEVSGTRRKKKKNLKRHK